MEAQGQKNNSPKELNDVRIGMQSIVGKVIGYCNLLLTEKEFKTIRFTAVGGAIGKLVNVVENLRIFHTGLFQSNLLSTVSYQAVDKQGKVFNERLHPKMEVTLSLEEPKEKTEGFQTKLDEEERKKLHDFMNARREQRQAEGPRGGRGGFRGRGRGRGGDRNRNYEEPRGERVERGGYRGGFQDESRGERVERSGYRGGYRGGFQDESRGERVERGGYRGGFGDESRGERGGFRGGFRGRGMGRGAPRGRGGFRGEFGGDRGDRGDRGRGGQFRGPNQRGTRRF